MALKICSNQDVILILEFGLQYPSINILCLQNYYFEFKKKHNLEGFNKQFMSTVLTLCISLRQLVKIGCLKKFVSKTRFNNGFKMVLIKNVGRTYLYNWSHIIQFSNQSNKQKNRILYSEKIKQRMRRKQAHMCSETSGCRLVRECSREQEPQPGL